MPDFQAIAPSSRRTTRTVRVGVVDLTGAKKNVILKDLGSGVTDAQVNAWRAAIGAASNGGVFFDEKTVTQQQEPRDSRAFSEAHSTVTDLGVLVFRNPNPSAQDVYVEVPAIHAGFIGDDGGISADIQEIDDIITTTLPMLNDNNPFTSAWFFSHAYYSDRKGNGKGKNSDIPTTVDPRGTPDPQP